MEDEIAEIVSLEPWDVAMRLKCSGVCWCGFGVVTLSVVTLSVATLSCEVGEVKVVR